MNKIKISSDKTYEYIDDEDLPSDRCADICPFCGDRTKSGSWSPDKCPTCGAVYFMNRWTRDIV